MLKYSRTTLTRIKRRLPWFNNTEFSLVPAMKLFVFSALLFLSGIENIRGNSTTNNWNLVWADDFNVNGLPDPSKWHYDVGGFGWWNNQLQYYTANRTENARVLDGNLIIEARKESYRGSNFTSARIKTMNATAGSQGNWLYGKIEVRAKLPGGRGVFPAIWLMPTDSVYGSDPNSGEIDVMEHVGFRPAIVYGTVHTNATGDLFQTGVSVAYNLPNCESDFNVYGMEWDSNEIRMYVNGNKYLNYTKPAQGANWTNWPFDRRFYLILNFAVGGNWGGEHGVDPNIWPQSLIVDYVKFYQ